MASLLALVETFYFFKPHTCFQQNYGSPMAPRQHSSRLAVTQLVGPYKRYDLFYFILFF